MSDLIKISDLRNRVVDLECLIKEAEEDGDVVGRLNFESLLKSVLSEIAQLERSDSRVAELALIYRGAPVKGTRSINASFAAVSISLFQAVVTRIFSSNLTGELARKGKIKGSDLSALNLSGIVRGSFGFVFEEQSATQYSALDTPVRQAVDQAARLIAEFTHENDDEFLVDVDSINPRIFNSLAKFFRHLQQNDAEFATKSPTHEYSFDRAAIERAYRRISNTSVRIESVIWEGTLVGLSPIKRTFDFRRDGVDSIVSGKFSHSVSQDYLERIESKGGMKLGARFSARIEVGTIFKPDGSSSISYTVTDLQEIAA